MDHLSFRPRLQERFRARIREETNLTTKLQKLHQKSKNGIKKSARGTKASFRVKKNRADYVQWLKDTRDYSFMFEDTVLDQNPVRPTGFIRPFVSDNTVDESMWFKKSRPSRDSPREVAKKDSCSIIPTGNPRTSLVQSKKFLRGERARTESVRNQEKAISGTIRRMFGHDPNKYSDHGDGRMEATFSEIEKEERRSMKTARKVDAAEQRKIVQGRKK